MLDTGYWMLDTGYSILVTRYWSLVTGKNKNNAEGFKNAEGGKHLSEVKPFFNSPFRFQIPLSSDLCPLSSGVGRATVPADIGRHGGRPYLVAPILLTYNE